MRERFSSRRLARIHCLSTERLRQIVRGDLQRARLGTEFGTQLRPAAARGRKGGQELRLLRASRVWIPLEQETNVLVDPTRQIS
jgi:hypothetical protein